MHVTFGTSKQRFLATPEEIKSKIEQFFSIDLSSDYLLQQWDADFNDWSNIENVSGLQGKVQCKLQVAYR
jgi:hypothetical protein